MHFYRFFVRRQTFKVLSSRCDGPFFLRVQSVLWPALSRLLLTAVTDRVTSQQVQPTLLTLFPVGCASWARCCVLDSKFGALVRVSFLFPSRVPTIAWAFLFQQQEDPLRFFYSFLWSAFAIQERKGYQTWFSFFRSVPEFRAQVFFEHQASTIKHILTLPSFITRYCDACLSVAFHARSAYLECKTAHLPSSKHRSPF